jgi:hypothetical protein
MDMGANGDETGGDSICNDVGTRRGTLVDSIVADSVVESSEWDEHIDDDDASSLHKPFFPCNEGLGFITI